MPYQLVNGIQMYYELHGAGEPLVMIMGLRRNSEWWYKQIPFLSRYFRLLVFDNRGAGRSEKPEMEYSIRLFAEDTAKLMTSLRITQAHVLGFSMGGYIAQELAINYPGLVRKLVLAGTGAGGKDAVRMTPEKVKKFIANEGLVPEEILRKDIDIYFSDRFIRENPRKIEEFIQVSLRWYQPEAAFLRQYNACLSHDTSDRLKQIKAPALILSGDDDPLVPPENSRFLNESLPHSDLYFYPEMRHCFLLEAGDQVNRRLLEYLIDRH